MSSHCERYLRHHAGERAGSLAESMAFRLLCDMHHLRSQVELLCNQAASLALEWDRRTEERSTKATRGQCDSPDQLRVETEELLMKLVDASAEIVKMLERQHMTERFLRLARKKSEWLEGSVEEGKPSDSLIIAEYGNRLVRNLESVIRRIDLDACQEATDRMTTVLLGHMTADEREEEERALHHVSGHGESRRNIEGDLFDPTTRATPSAASWRLQQHEAAR